MDLIADLLLISAAVGAAFYCFVLSRRLTSLNSAESGIGKLIGELSDQVARLQQALDTSRHHAEQIEGKLNLALERAEAFEALLESQDSSLVPKIHSVPAPQTPRSEARPASFRRRLFSEAATGNKQ